MIEGGKNRERLTVSPTQCASLVHRGHLPSPQSSQHPCLGSEHSTPRRMPRPRIARNQHNLTPHNLPAASLWVYSQEIHHPRHLYRLRSPCPLPQVRTARQHQNVSRETIPAPTSSPTTTRATTEEHFPASSPQLSRHPKATGPASHHGHGFTASS